MTTPHLDRQYIKDLPVSRRSLLRGAAGGVGLAAGLGMSGFASAAAPQKPTLQKPFELVSDNILPNAKTPLWGMAMAYGEQRLDLIDLDNSQILHSMSGFQASHAITPIEHLNRFVIHGYRPESRTGALLVFEVNPETKAWKIVLDKDIKGGRPLHWQPRPDLSEIVFNTIGDGALHVLDTRTLEVTKYVGGGIHSNMAMMDDLLIATDQMAGPSQLLITDRKTNKVLTKTSVNNWGHGVTVNFERGEAYVWAKDGVHRISLAQKSMGKHLGLIPSREPGERCWFCWTPQGSRFSHDVAWNWEEGKGDVYGDYLTALDMKTARIERIATGSKDIRPSFLQVSPDGKWGLSSLRGRDDIGVFNLEKNSFEGTVEAGAARKSFFERDMAFCKNRDFALVTNTAEKSVSLLNLKTKQEHRRIYLPRKPDWFKALSV